MPIFSPTSIYFACGVAISACMPESKAKALGASLGKFAPRVLVRRKKNTLFGKGLRKAAHLIVISPKTRFFGSVPVPGGPFLGIYVPKIVRSSGSCSFYC